MTKVIILAAGQGTRLKPLTNDRPKCLVEIEGRALLDVQLEVIKTQQISEITIVGGYRDEMLRREDCMLIKNERYYETNMVWTLFCAEQHFGDDLIVSYGDIVYSQECLNQLLKSDADISVVVDRDWEKYWRLRSEDPLNDAESLKINSKGNIIEIGQKASSVQEIQGQYIGLMRFNKKGISILKEVFHQAIQEREIRGKNPENAYMTDLLQLIIDKGFEVKPTVISGSWIEIDSVEDTNLIYTKETFLNIQKNL